MISLPTSILQGLETGRVRDLFALDERDFDIGPIAHRLAQLNRYCGALRWPYSVATHSVVVSRLAPAEFSLQALLHDITESFGIGDLISPIKRKDEFFNAVESRIRTQLQTPFGIQLCEPPEVHAADVRAWHLECLYFRGAWPQGLSETPSDPTDIEEKIAHEFLLQELSWRQSRDAFLSRYHYLKERDDK